MNHHKYSRDILSNNITHFQERLLASQQRRSPQSSGYNLNRTTRRLSRDRPALPVMLSIGTSGSGECFSDSNDSLYGGVDAGLSQQSYKVWMHHQQQQQQSTTDGE